MRLFIPSGPDALPTLRVFNTSVTSDGMIIIESNEFSLCITNPIGKVLSVSFNFDWFAKKEFNKFAFPFSSKNSVSVLSSKRGGIEVVEQGEMRVFKVFHQSREVKAPELILSERQSR
jgi:hypothetical protein